MPKSIRQSTMQPIILREMMRIRHNNLGWGKEENRKSAKQYIKYRYKDLREEFIKIRNWSLHKRLRSPFE